MKTSGSESSDNGTVTSSIGARMDRIMVAATPLRLLSFNTRPEGSESTQTRAVQKMQRREEICSDSSVTDWSLLSIVIQLQTQNGANCRCSSSLKISKQRSG